MLPPDPRKSPEDYMNSTHRMVWDSMYTLTAAYMRLHPYWEDNMTAQKQLYDAIVPKTLSGRFIYRKFQNTQNKVMMVVYIGNFSYGVPEDVVLADGETLSWESAWKHGRRLYMYVQDSQVCNMVRFPQDSPDCAEVNTTRILDARRTAIPMYVCPDNMPNADQAGFMMGRRMRVPTLVPARQCNVPITTTTAKDVITTYCPERPMSFNNIPTIYVKSRRTALNIRVQLHIPKQTLSLYLIMLILEVSSVEDIMAMVFRTKDWRTLPQNMHTMYQELREMVCEQKLKAKNLQIVTRADALGYIRIDMTDMEQDLTDAAQVLHTAMGEEDVKGEDLNDAAAQALGAKREDLRQKATNMERMFNMRLTRMFCNLLPNVSTMDNTEVNHRKAAIICHMVLKLVKVWYGDPPDNRDAIVRHEDWSLNVGRMLYQAGRADISAARHAISKGHNTDSIHPHPVSTARGIIVNAINQGTTNRSRAVFNTARPLALPIVDTQTTKSIPPEGATAESRKPHATETGVVCPFSTPDGTQCNLVQHLTGTVQRRVLHHYTRGTIQFARLATSEGFAEGKAYTEDTISDGALFELFDDVRTYKWKGRRWRTQPFERVIQHAFGGENEEGALSGMAGVEETIMAAKDAKEKSWAAQQEEAERSQALLDSMRDDVDEEDEEVIAARKKVTRMERIRSALGDGCGEGNSVPDYLMSDTPMVLVDGTPMGVINRDVTPQNLADRLRAARRSGHIDRLTGISLHHMGVELRTQPGAMLTPAIRLDMLSAALEVARTAANAVDAVNTMESMGIIDMLDREERMECVVAESITQVLTEMQELRKSRWKAGVSDWAGPDDLWADCHFTHLMLHPAASLHAHAIRNMPWANCNEGPRALFFSQMIPQVTHFNAALTNTGVVRQCYRQPMYVQSALVTTIAEHEMTVVRSDNRVYQPPMMGVQATIAVMNYKGRKDDCVVVSQGFIDRMAMGQFEYSRRTFDKLPSVTLTRNIVNKRQDLNGLHQLGPDGIIRVGSVVRNKTILVGAGYFPKDGAQPKDYTMVFNAVAIMRNQQWRVHKVEIVNGMRTGALKIHITLRRFITFVRGMKLCLDCGQKFTVADIIPQHAMPFPENPNASPIDVILAPEALIGRNTLSGPLEMATGIVAAMEGRRYDATVYHPNMAPCPDDFSKPCKTFRDALGDSLVKLGFSRDGSFVLHDGETGLLIGATRAERWPATPILCGSMRLMCLYKHDPREKGFSRGVHGTTSMVTNNPTGGRKNHGAVRHGEMEKDATEVYGAAKTCSSYIMDGGSACVVPICSVCGQVASKKSEFLMQRMPPELRSRVKGLADFHSALCKGGEISLVRIPQVTLVMMDIMRMANVRFNIFTAP
jgi:DNA-directed RNA polymerase subunit B'